MSFRRHLGYRRRSMNKYKDPVGTPKYKDGDIIGDFTVIMYMGHSTVNKRNNRIMSKPQHWYRCRCRCGEEESRSQQELRDVRRNQMCESCRHAVALEHHHQQEETQ